MVYEAQPVDGNNKEQTDVQGRVEADALVILGFLIYHQEEWGSEIALSSGSGNGFRPKPTRLTLIGDLRD